MRCESNYQERRHCKVDTSPGVILSTQLSEAGCWRDDTWGYDSTGIWVSNGCRAEFIVGDIQSSSSDKSGALIGGLIAAGVGAALVGALGSRDNDPYYHGDGPGFGYGNVVRCDSNNMYRNYCDVGRVRRAEIRRQFSRAPCQYGRTWGYDRRGLWVDRGCRAEFWVSQ
jgi:Protein of unknown function (DUF3011)